MGQFLNEAQKKAVEHCGNLLIIAGPGTGKTHTLTHKIAHTLICIGSLPEGGLKNTHVPPSSILALTFTKKAADEMKQRLISLRSNVENTNPQNLPFVGTFHAWCLEVLRKFVDKKSDFSHSFILYGEEERMLVLRDIVSSTFPHWTKKQIIEASRLISLRKNQLLQIETITEDMQVAHSFTSTELLTISRLYEKKMSDLQALDFDDLLVKALDLFAHPSAEIEAYRNNLRYIFIDEYQDVNTVQYQLIRLLMYSDVQKTSATDGCKTICAIGDPDQSIYSFRGSNIDYFLRFSEDFPRAVTLHLEENYRSSSFIIKASESLIAYNTKRIQRSIHPQKEDTMLISVMTASDAWKEAYCVTKEVKKLVGGIDMIEAGYDYHHARSEIFRFSDIAVLYRTKAQGRIIETSLRKAGIPCQMVPESAWYLKKEIQSLLHYLRVLVHPHDDANLLKILQTPPRDKKSVSVFLTQIHALMDELTRLTPTECALKVWNDFGFERHFCGEKMKSPKNGLQHSVKQDDFVKLNRKNEKIRHNFLLFLSTSAQFDLTKGKDGLVKLLEHYSLLKDEDAFDETVEAVSLMTIHSSKGLEFPVVFITGLEDGLLPYKKATHDTIVHTVKNASYENERLNNRLEEERRLLYVGITRAKRKLYLLHALSRNGNKYSPSPFLKEIREELLERKEFQRRKNHHDQIFNDQEARKKAQLQLFS